MSSCLGRAAVPVKRVWRGLSARLRRRRRTTGKLSTYVPVSPDDDHHHEADDDMDFGVLAAGLGRLRKEVRTCEYHDVHVMWEMLSNTGGSTSCRGAMDDDDTAAAGKKGAAATAARRTRKGRKPAPWSRLVAYCCAF
ncbi:hypothetical protein EJB05_13772, partial [Eragrostis curvula]